MNIKTVFVFSNIFRANPSAAYFITLFKGDHLTVEINRLLYGGKTCGPSSNYTNSHDFRCSPIDSWKETERIPKRMESYQFICDDGSKKNTQGQ